MHHESHLRELGLEVDCAHAPDTTLDASAASLVRLAALIAVGAALPSIHREVDTALGAGLGTSEIVAVLDELIPVIGRPRVVAAAPLLAQALGIELDVVTDDP